MPSEYNRSSTNRNVAGFLTLVKKLQERDPHTPNFGVMYGRSGEGKSYASIHAQNKTRAIRVEIGESWNRKTFVRAILLECGVGAPRGATADLVAEAIGILGDDARRPLIIDEADKLVDKGLIEIVREISEASQVPVLLIGEEQLPQKLRKWERVHGRMLDWVQAQPASIADAKHLVKLYCRGAEVADDLLTALHTASGGSVRRICVNLDRVREKAETAGISTIGIAEYGADFFTGNPPARRS